MSEISEMKETTADELKQKAIVLTARINANGQLAARAVFEIARDLRTMKIEKLYTQLDYETFEEYAEREFDIKKRQAQSYIAVYEKLGESFVQLNAQLGITKLSLLTQLDAEDRRELTENSNLAGMTVNQVQELINKVKLQGEQLSMFEEEKKKISEEAESDKEFYGEKIEELKKLNDKLRGKLQAEEEKNRKSEKEATKAAGRLSIVQTDYDMAQEYISKIQKENQELKKEIEELENKPVDVAVPEPEIKEVVKEIIKEVPDKKALEEKDREILTLKNKYKALDEARIEEHEKLKKSYEERIAQLQKPPEKPADSEKNSFKLLYAEAYKSCLGLIEFIKSSEDKEKELFTERTDKLLDIVRESLHGGGNNEDQV